MCYLICEKCNSYYKLKEGESLDDFETCKCGGCLNYTNNLNTNFIYAEKKLKNAKRNTKLFSSSFNLIFSIIITISILIFILYFSLINLIMDHSSLISLLLIIVLVFRFIFKETKINNSVLRSLINRSIYLIIPLTVFFIITIVYMVINSLK